MGKKRLILFDFDGTIADTVRLVVSILNDLSDHFGYRKIDEKTLEYFRNQRNQAALKEVGLAPYKILLIANRVKKEVGKNIEAVKPIAGMKEVIADLIKNGDRLGIVTTGSKKNVEGFLKNNNIEGFEFIHASRHFFKKDRILKRLLKKHQMPLTEVIYIGDQTSDIEAARKVSIKAISVGWGFNSETVLRQGQPDAFVNDPGELLAVIRDTERA